MGVLDEAIRQHLELKRAHGASEDELERQEAEALGPARREPSQGNEEGDEDQAAQPRADDLSAGPAPEGGARTKPSAEKPSSAKAPAAPGEAEADEVPADEALELGASVEARAGPDIVAESEESAGPSRVFDVEELGPPGDADVEELGPPGEAAVEELGPPEDSVAEELGPPEDSAVERGPAAGPVAVPIEDEPSIDELEVDEEVLDAEEEAEEELAEELASGGPRAAGEPLGDEREEGAHGVEPPPPIDSEGAAPLRAFEEDTLYRPQGAAEAAEAETDEHEVQDDMLVDERTVEGDLIEEELLEEEDLLEDELADEVGPPATVHVPADEDLDAEDDLDDAEEDDLLEDPGDEGAVAGPSPGADEVADDDEDALEEDEDVLEETPEFLEETPEHERLWFDQKPPGDFDLDR